ncbi:uncharacterized protein DFL_005493 [Arthrobotrys flagrans]|uniref:Uncharacterized protein n=1 Tax=Arthrobotrys flagrans TaxID=97331 RepID=A0A436ZY98_ARTFL|nr:hypothetical protein DFL_005493 [Arthrobotrys flagrans]
MLLTNLFLAFILSFGTAFATYTEIEDVFTVVRDGPGACNEKEAYTINLYHMDIVSMLEAGLEMFNDALERETMTSNRDIHLRQIGARLMIESWFGIEFKDPDKDSGEDTHHAPTDLELFLYIQGGS